jgi:hypothetical protein
MREADTSTSPGPGTVSDHIAVTFCRLFGHRWKVGPWQECRRVIAGVTHTRRTTCLRCPEVLTEPHHGIPGTPPDEGP